MWAVVLHPPGPSALGLTGPFPGSVTLISWEAEAGAGRAPGAPVPSTLLMLAPLPLQLLSCFPTPQEQIHRHRELTARIRYVTQGPSQ